MSEDRMTIEEMKGRADALEEANRWFRDMSAGDWWRGIAEICRRLDNVAAQVRKRGSDGSVDDSSNAATTPARSKRRASRQ